MGSIPEGSMFSQGGIGMGMELSLKGSMLVWGDDWQAARRRLWSKVGTGSFLSQPAFESADAESKGDDNLLARHATSHSCKDALT
jgi:hypothetical protein